MKNKSLLGIALAALLLLTYTACRDASKTASQSAQASLESSAPAPVTQDSALQDTFPEAPSSPVLDMVGVLTPEDINDIAEDAVELDNLKLAQVAVVVVDDLKGMKALDYATALANKWGVGHKETNRGLVIVVAYKDRKYFIAPGSGLEADLTDAECNQLARTYLTPFMKAFNPNGGMLALTEATYNLLNGKEMPDEPSDYQLSHGAQQEDEGDFEAFVFMLLFFWLVLYSQLDQKCWR